MQKAAASALFRGIIFSKPSKLHMTAVGSSRLPDFTGRSSRIWWHTGNSCAADAVLRHRHCLQTHSGEGGINYKLISFSWDICSAGSCIPDFFFFFRLTAEVKHADDVPVAALDFGSFRKNLDKRGEMDLLRLIPPLLFMEWRVGLLSISSALGRVPRVFAGVWKRE